MVRRALRPIPLAVALVVTSVLGASSWWLVALVDARYQAQVDARVVQSSSSVYAVLESELSQTLYLAQGLAGLIAYDPDLGGLDDGPVAEALAAVDERSDHLRNIGLAPDNTLQHVYPLEGNESAIGLRYEDVPAQWPDVRRAMETGQTVLAGPVDLVQGGRGLINRTPVILDDGRYWGIISLVIDVDSVIDEVGRVTGDLPIRWALRTRPADGRPATPVAGDQTLFEGEATRRPVDILGGNWELAAVADDSVLAEAPPLGLLRAAGAGMALLVGALALAVVVQHEGVRELSLHDPLTGLPNRRLLLDRLATGLRASARGGVGCSVLAIDLDGFKALNDALGHAAGDAALKEVAARLAREVRGADTVARLGGDEFVVFLPDTRLRHAAGSLAPRLLAALTWDVEQDGTTVPLSATIGAAHGPTHAADAGALLGVADGALYRGKREGRGRIALPSDAPVARSDPEPRSADELERAEP